MREQLDDDFSIFRILIRRCYSCKRRFVEKINQSKAQSGKDIIVYGGATFVSSLIKERLIVELYLFINPVILEKGLPIFRITKIEYF